MRALVFITDISSQNRFWTTRTESVYLLYPHLHLSGQAFRLTIDKNECFQYEYTCLALTFSVWITSRNSILQVTGKSLLLPKIVHCCDHVSEQTTIGISLCRFLLKRFLHGPKLALEAGGHHAVLVTGVWTGQALLLQHLEPQVAADPQHVFERDLRCQRAHAFNVSRLQI